jgi:hypothetical protein
MHETRWITTVISAGFLAVAIAGNTWSAEWSFEPSFSARGEYNDNLTLTSLPHDAVWGGWLTPDLKVKGATEHMDIKTGATADFVSYRGGKDTNFTNLNFPLLAHYRSEKDTLMLDTSFVRDNTLIGELQQTGVVVSFTQRNRLVVAPAWTHALTETLAFQGSYQFNDVTYEDGLQFNLFNYTLHAGNAGLSYSLTERDTIQGMAQYVDFTVPQAQLHSTYYGLHLTLTHAFSESLSATVSGGGRTIMSESSTVSPPATDRTTVGLFSASVEKTFERGLVRVEAAREINPSGLGLLLQTDRVSLRTKWDVTERLNAAFNASMYWTQSVVTRENTRTFPDNRYFRIEPLLSYRLTEHWMVSGSYSYSYRDIALPGDLQRASANATYLMLTYHPLKFAVSR